VLDTEGSHRGVFCPDLGTLGNQRRFSGAEGTEVRK
jgi:hypothetical protein